MRTFIVAAALVGNAHAYISPVTAGQVLTQDFLDNEVIVTPGDNIGCLSYPVNFSHADISNNNLGGIKGFPLTPGGCFNAIANEYEACASQTSETIKLEGVAEDPAGNRIDCIVSIDDEDELASLYTTVEGNNGRQQTGTLFSIGVLSFDKAGPLLFSFYYASGAPVTLPEFVFALLDSDSDGPDGTTLDISGWPANNLANPNFIDQVSLREYMEIRAMGGGQLYAYYTATDTQVVHIPNVPAAGWVTVKSSVFGAGAPPELDEGGVPTSYSCPSDWNDADDNTDKEDFLNRITPTVNTCDDGNPTDPIEINGRPFTEQQAQRTVFIRFFNTQQLKVRLYTVGTKPRDVSRNYLWTGINQPFPCPPPPSAPPSAPPPPFCDVCTERDPKCPDECVECLDLAINKDGCCTQECISCLEEKYADGEPSSMCASVCSGCGADFASKCGPVEACSMPCSPAGMDFAEQCGPFVICEYCDRVLEDKPFCLRECRACPPARLLCSDCAMPDFPLKDDVRCSTEGPYACVDSYPVECSTSPLNSLCPQCGGEDIEYCLDCFPPTPPMPPPFPPPFPPKAALKYDKQRYDPNRHFNK